MKYELKNRYFMQKYMSICHCNSKPHSCVCVLSPYAHRILPLPHSGIISVDLHSHQHESMARSPCECMEFYKECDYFLNSECSDRRAKCSGAWWEPARRESAATYPDPAEALVVIETLVLDGQFSAQRDAELPALRGQSKSHSQQTQCYCQLSSEQRGNSILGIHLVWNGRD